MAFDFGDLHGAAQGNHGDEEDGDAEDVEGFVEGLGDAQCANALVSAGICCCFPVDLCHIHVGALSQSLPWMETLLPVDSKWETTIEEVVLDCCY